MQNTKELLKSEKALSDWWSETTKHANFRQIMMYLKAHAFEAKPSPEESEGISKFISSMTDIIEPEPEAQKFASPGLLHDDSHVRRTVDLNAPKEKTVTKPTTKKGNK